VRVRPSTSTDAAGTGPEPTPAPTASPLELLPSGIVESAGASREGFLAIDGVSKSFGGLRAVSNVSFSVARGQLVAVIGPNGAGKTTLFNLITGVYPTAGAIRFAGRSCRACLPTR
jgi:ABC-type multidrug transport system fused ATPase/permease subunit